MHITQKLNDNNLKTMLVSDFISSFGSVFLTTTFMLALYQQTGSLLTASWIPFITMLINTFFTPIIGNLHVKITFRKLFILGELAAASFVYLLTRTQHIVLLLFLYILYRFVFFVLEAFRAEYLKMNTEPTEIHKWQSLSQMVNSFVPVIANLVLAFLFTQLKSTHILYIVAGLYLLAAAVILRIDGIKRPVEQTGPPQKPWTLFKTTNSPNATIFFHVFCIIFLGSMASLATLSYVVDYLKQSDSAYSLLMSVMALGATLGGLVVRSDRLKAHAQQISTIGVLCMGLLLLSVVFRPGFEVLLGIFLISGIISSAITTYYAIAIYQQTPMESIRLEMAKFSVVTQAASGFSQPFSGGYTGIVGPIIALVSAGVGFILLFIKQKLS